MGPWQRRAGKLHPPVVPFLRVNASPLAAEQRGNASRQGSCPPWSQGSTRHAGSLSGQRFSEARTHVRTPRTDRHTRAAGLAQPQQKVTPLASVRALPGTSTATGCQQEQHSLG